MSVDRPGYHVVAVAGCVQAIGRETVLPSERRKFCGAGSQGRRGGAVHGGDGSSIFGVAGRRMVRHAVASHLGSAAAGAHVAGVDLVICRRSRSCLAAAGRELAGDILACRDRDEPGAKGKQRDKNRKEILAHFHLTLVFLRHQLVLRLYLPVEDSYYTLLTSFWGALLA